MSEEEIRLIRKHFEEYSVQLWKELYEYPGYGFYIKDGWVVKRYKNGEIEKIKKLK